MSRRLALTGLLPLLAFAVAGCGVSQRDVENQIRVEMGRNMGVTVWSFDLKEEPDASYVGTATTTRGDVYDVTAKVVDGKPDWKAIPGQAMMEADIRRGIERQYSRRLKTLQLTKTSPGVFFGKAELATGERFDLKAHFDGREVKWDAQAVVR